jgi:tripartite-type tricarboxylate transporter receptor subunit TctC
VPASIAYLLFSVLAMFAGCSGDAHQSGAFPRKPIKIVVYTGPGGLIDVTARRFAEIASQHADATFVVENHPGAGGLVATKRVLQLPADGYTLYACTRSNISKLVASGGRSFIDSMSWIAMLIADPECIITRAGSSTSSWQQLIDDARARPGEQIWLGPDTGGLDHLMALKTWDRCGISAKWIPYKSGGEAKAALLGGQGAVYVGNPSDAIGNPDLSIAAVSSVQRLERFPQVPTLSELGLKGLDAEFMWRGFAVKRGTPPEVLAWYDELFRRVTQDPQWRSTWEESGIEVLYHDTGTFDSIVRQDEKDFAHYLSRLGIVQPAEIGTLAQLLQDWGLGALAAVILLFAGLAVPLLRRTSLRGRAGHVVIPAMLLCMALLFLAATFAFAASDEVGPVAIPRLWIGVLVPVCAGLLYRAVRGRDQAVRRGPRFDLVVRLGVLLVAYVAGIHLVGYVASSAVFLPLAMLLLGERSLHWIALVTLVWVAGSYAVFVRVLFVPLPSGRLWEPLL